MLNVYKDIIDSPTVTETEAVDLYHSKMDEIAKIIQSNPKGEAWVPAVIIGVSKPIHAVDKDGVEKTSQLLYVTPSPLSYDQEGACTWNNALPIYTEWVGTTSNGVDEEEIHKQNLKRFSAIEESGRRMRAAANEAGIPSVYWRPFMYEDFDAEEELSDFPYRLLGVVVEVRYRAKLNNLVVDMVRPVTVDASNVVDLLPCGYAEDTDEGETECEALGLVCGFKFLFPTPTYKSEYENKHTIFEDDRQKPDMHTAKHAMFEAHGYAVKPCRLGEGDYYCAAWPELRIDTKAGYDELVSNLCDDEEFSRVRRECLRAIDKGETLVFAVHLEPEVLENTWTNPVCRSCYLKCENTCLLDGGEHKPTMADVEGRMNALIGSLKDVMKKDQYGNDLVSFKIFTCEEECADWICSVYELATQRLVGFNLDRLV